MKRLLLLGIIIALVMISCHSKKKEEHKQQDEIITVSAQPSSTKLFFSGIIQPQKTVVIISPADGVIQEMLFHFGDKVQANQMLFTISSEKFQTDYKNALMQYIKAKNEFNTNHTQLMQSEFLHKNQLISDDEFKNKKSGYYNAQLALVQAKEALSAMLKQLTVQGLNIDELTIENIDKITQALHAQGDSQKLRVKAPAAGVVLLPVKSDAENETKKIGKGDQVKQGDVLGVVGDVAGLNIRVSVNEFNINQLKIGQKVKVTGAAFPNITLQGLISGIDRQAQQNSSGMPVFPIEITVPKLTEKEQEIIHMGMSAKVEINIESEAKISIPIAAVIEKNGAAFVKVQNSKTGKIQELAVKTGQTTEDSVIIESDLKEGDKVVITR